MTQDEHFPFTVEDVASAWDAGADAWDEFIESGQDFYRLEIHGPGLLAACGDVQGKRVLDVGCGQGYFARQLARSGADVLGVDVSERQIAHARRYEIEDPLGIGYEVLDAARVGERWKRGDFSLITACMSIQDTPEPAAVLRSAASLLVPGSRFIYSIPNPTTTTPHRQWERDEAGRKLSLKIDRYFESGPRRMQWNMARLARPWCTPMVHATLSETTATIADAGLLLARIHEPRATPEQVARQPRLEGSARLPYFLIFDCVKAP